MKRCVLLMMAAVHIAVLSGCSTLHDAAQKNDIVEIQTKIDKGTVVDSLNEFGDTPLIMAAVYGRTAAAKLLIEKGANVNFVNNVGNTPLSLAALKGDTENMRRIVKMPYRGIWRRLKGLKGATSETMGESAKRKIIQ